MYRLGVITKFFADCLLQVYVIPVFVNLINSARRCHSLQKNLCTAIILKSSKQKIGFKQQFMRWLLLRFEINLQKVIILNIRLLGTQEMGEQTTSHQELRNVEYW